MRCSPALQQTLATESVDQERSKKIDPHVIVFLQMSNCIQLVRVGKGTKEHSARRLLNEVEITVYLWLNVNCSEICASLSHRCLYPSFHCPV